MPTLCFRSLLPGLLLASLLGCQQMPEDLSTATPLRPAEQVELLFDQTWRDSQGQEHVQQQIMDRVLTLIGGANDLIVVDMFLFNDFAGEHSHRALSSELTDALIAARQRHPQMPVVLITDPFNTLYGGVESAQFEALRGAGVDVVMTDLSQLPASNPTWTGIWTLCCSYLGNSTRGGWLPNPVGEGKVTLRTYLHLLNFRANHRKTLIVGHNGEWTGLVTSMNPHDASSRHDNSAVQFSGAAALDLLQTERAVALLSGYAPAADWPAAPAVSGSEPPQLQVLTEGAIEQGLLQLIDSAQAGDALDLEMFYLSSRPVIEALIQAHQRGATLRVILDPNRDAFGREKNGIPNRQAAWDLHEAGIAVRWCATEGEQCHRKWIRLERTDGSAELIAGSANFTRRNLHDLNLETSVRLVSRSDGPQISQQRGDFEREWQNANGAIYSLPYADFADHSRWRYLVYRFMEASGLSTF
ncbi:phospholipase [Halopseudomonas pachastrellae]|uniref:phospholipase D n=1 Tax=Halopseudomonas pachastrellae TaxID=254161 RepID=A0A1S8DFI4_9GAMM|nr:phospholipase D-like domain-containing protein [Halopseudomonas pachastrellae]ONM43392.1 phospholipase [Halopseudomonas pachastrellae]SFM86488.1 PLD-like domain-containing protein [Halopseudomonas pachastrellae]